MKIAVATIDGNSLSQHFGQSKGFVVVDVNGDAITSREFRTNYHTPHAQGLCNHGHDHEHGHEHGHGHHSHGNIVELLRDCDAVLCGGMGAGAAQALQQNGIKPSVIRGPLSIDDAVSTYLSGGASSEIGLCGCHH